MVRGGCGVLGDFFPPPPPSIHFQRRAITKRRRRSGRAIFIRRRDVVRTRKLNVIPRNWRSPPVHEARWGEERGPDGHALNKIYSLFFRGNTSVIHANGKTIICLRFRRNVFRPAHFSLNVHGRSSADSLKQTENKNQFYPLKIQIK